MAFWLLLVLLLVLAGFFLFRRMQKPDTMISTRSLTIGCTSLQEVTSSFENVFAGNPNDDIICVLNLSMDRNQFARELGTQDFPSLGFGVFLAPTKTCPMTKLVTLVHVDYETNQVTLTGILYKEEILTKFVFDSSFQNQGIGSTVSLFANPKGNCQPFNLVLVKTNAQEDPFYIRKFNESILVEATTDSNKPVLVVGDFAMQKQDWTGLNADIFIEPPSKSDFETTVYLLRKGGSITRYGHYTDSQSFTQHSVAI